MVGTTEIFTNRWWRFDEYEVADGYLRPKPGAVLTAYEPWAAYAKCVERNSDERPYLALVELAERIIADSPEQVRWAGGPLSPASSDALVAWAASNGLLGLALQRTEQVELAPRWTHLPTGGVTVVKSQRQTVVKTRVRYARTPTGWTELIDCDKDWSSFSADDSLAEQIVAPDVLPTNWSPGSALVRAERGTLVLEPIEQSWGPFFPDVSPLSKQSHRYPLPLTDEFWNAYGEPVSEFLRAAVVLGAAAREAARLDGMSDTDLESLDDYSYQRIYEAVESLQSLVAPMAPTLDRAADDNSLRLHWTGPSLLGLFAMMILLDLTSRMKLHSCEECHGLFLSPSPAASYCSDPCRWRYQKRVQRKRRPTDGTKPTDRPKR